MQLRILLLGLPLIAACVPGAREPRGIGPCNGDAGVYAAALDSLAPAGKPIAVLDSTLTIRSDAPLLADDNIRGMGVDSAMRESIRARSRTSALVPRIPLRRRVSRLRRGDIPLDASGRGLNLALLPGGFYRLSAVGYSADGTRAVVYVTHSCGLRCGESWLVVLNSGADGWRVVTARMLMVV